MNILFKAGDILKSTDPVQKAQFIENIHGLLFQIYNFSSSATSAAIARILEDLLRILLMLMLNMVRCDENINEQGVSMILQNLGMFHEMVSQLIKRYPQLDLKDLLQNEVEEFTVNFRSQFDVLINALKILISDLANFPA